MITIALFFGVLAQQCIEPALVLRTEPAVAVSAIRLQSVARLGEPSSTTCFACVQEPGRNTVHVAFSWSVGVLIRPGRTIAGTSFRGTRCVASCA